MTTSSPRTFTIIRSGAIAAPPEKIFPLINDFHAWVGWSPWENIDHDLAKTYSGPHSGVGAIYEWSGKKTGQGRMEITQASPSSLINIDLRFLKPFKADNLTGFRLTPTDEGTTVTWSMTGKTTFVSKLMGLFMNMDKMVGASFEQGLGALKTLVESEADGQKLCSKRSNPI
jgi:hypothetical protein